MSTSSASEQTALRLLQLIRQLGSPLRIRPARLHGLYLDSHFDRDLGLDSLTRMELFARVETEFGVHLAEAVYANVETVGDLLRALLSAQSGAGAVPTESLALRLESSEPAPQGARTWLEVLDWHAERQPERPHVRFYEDDGQGATITYGQLREQAHAVAAGLQERGLKSREAVAIMLPTGSDYFFAFFGVLAAGGIPVPVYPPARPSQLEDHLLRHRAILDNCGAVLLVTVPEARQVARLLQAHVASLRGVATVTELVSTGATLARPNLGTEDIAFLQYTSGSTGIPKGVMLTHANLLANVRAMGDAVGATSEDVFVSWLPLYHDMGLIGAWLGSLYFAMPLVNFSPLSFLARPSRWLTAVQRHGGTLTAAPNFAYELCLKRLKADALKGLDLSSLRWVFNGAEPVNPETLESFCEQFGLYGLKRSAMAPVYGLAENAVGLAFPPVGRGPLFDRIERQALAEEGVARPCERVEGSVRFPACGLPLAGHEIRIVDETGRELPERRQGHLEFRGPSATAGYYRNPEQTRLLLRDGWVRSGDLAYLAGGEVYITGRLKDVIIHAGRNLYPHELESAVGQLPGVRAGCVAVFGSRDAASGTEQLVVMAETREDDPSSLEKLRSGIEDLAMDLLGLAPDQVAFVPPHTVLKTSSGKVRRSACRELYESGLAENGPRSAKSQMLRLTLAAGLPELRRRLRQAGLYVYGAYAWAALTAFGVLAALGVMLCPDAAWRWRIVHHLAGTLSRCTFVPLTVRGLEHLPTAGQPCLYVSNHASYSDVIALTAALPKPCAFVAKVELADNPVLAALLRRLGVIFVERFDRRRVVEDAQRLAEQARGGHDLLYFPEGTFTRAVGLRPFRLGAFQAAVQANLPVVPIALKGSRDLLRDGTWLPRRSALTVTFGPPLDPANVREKENLADEWSLAQRLMDLTRAHILRHCGEPDLEHGAGP